jgi:hypothetical protein
MGSLAGFRPNRQELLNQALRESLVGIEQRSVGLCHDVTHANSFGKVNADPFTRRISLYRRQRQKPHCEISRNR